MTKYFAILLAIMGCLYLSHSGDFWHQLRTYRWRSESVTVASFTLKAEKLGFWDGGTMGEICFKVDRDGSNRLFKDHLSQRFSFDRALTKSNGFISALAPGTKHVAFISPDSSEISFGHFPRDYGHSFALSGASSLLMALFFWWRGKPKPREA